MPIIVASSNVFRRELSSYILSDAGYTVHEATTTAALLQSLAQIAPRLVVLDPWLNGGTWCEMVHTIRQRSAAPIIAIVTPAQLSERLGSSDTGDAALIWPFLPVELLECVHAMLDPCPAAESAQDLRLDPAWQHHEKELITFHRDRN